VLEGLVLATQSTSTSALLALTGILNFLFFKKQNWLNLVIC